MADSFSILEGLDQQDKADPFTALEQLDQSAPAISAQASPNASSVRGPWDPRQLVDPEAWKRTLKLGGRAVAKGLLSIPALPLDAATVLGNGARNLEDRMMGRGPSGNAELPSVGMDRELDQVFGTPQSNVEKVGSFALSTVAGSKFPIPQVANKVPNNFVAPSASPVAETLKQAREAGYVVPPATAAPSLLTKALEGATGKISTAQAASSRNQAVTNKLVRKALGMADDEPITAESLEKIRDTAGKVYERIASAGEIRPDSRYLDDLATLGKSADDIAKSFPGANVGATKQIDELVDSLLQNKFDSKAALQYLRELRKQASGNLSGMNAADPAKQALGMAQREAASILEDQIGRHLEGIGQKDLADAFSGARKQIAMSHTVEKALNEATGNVVAGKLGQQMAKGKPLTDELRIAAKFAQAFPKAAKEVTESMPGISPLDIYASVGGGLISGQPWMAAIPATRLGLRELLLSSPMQKFSTGDGVRKAAPNALGLAPSAAIQLLTEH